MSKRDFIGGTKGGIVLEDVGGSFARFIRETPKLANQYRFDVVEKTAFAMANRMRALAPVGPDAPHIRENITHKRRGGMAMVGVLDGAEPAAPGSTASLADVALFNEYSPNKQPFMRPAAEAEAPYFVRRMTDAMQQLERDLSAGRMT